MTPPLTARGSLQTAWVRVAQQPKRHAPAPMKPLSRDTPLEVERVWLEGLRAKGAAWRLYRTLELSSACWRSAIAAYERAHPGASRTERDLWLVRERYGDDLARRVEARLRELADAAR